MVVNITENEIKNGKPRECSDCAMALALKNQGYRYVEVDPDTTTVEMRKTKRGKKYKASIGSYLLDWLEAFDRGENVSPIKISNGADVFDIV